MIQYKLSIENSHRHFIQIEAIFPCDKIRTQLQLPSWRPGRYELGNFAKNIRSFSASDINGKKLPFKKLNKDLWEIESEGLNFLKLNYEFYADVLNAGSTFLDEQILYVNPVNCFFYSPDLPNEEIKITLEIPETHKVACSLRKGNRNHELLASSVQELMDSPFMASAYLDYFSYTEGNCLFHVWMNGQHRIDKAQMQEEFQAFTKAQIKAFNGIPCDEYHFLFHFLPYKAYHGVEHEKSTVIALGPSSELMEPAFYRELLGVSCHELYHTWNIKNIRPIEMSPYSFERENYSELGYVAEGVTTYFGDQFLLRSDVFSEEEYFQQLSMQVQRHLDNPGRKNLSVAESSFDTWLDGYVPGIPWRKVSIYNEGALCSIICDLRILESTNAAKSLDDVMRRLYEDFGQKGRGYSQADYKNIMEDVSGVSMDDIFNDLIWGTEDYLPYLKNALEWIGCEIQESNSLIFHEANWGIKVDEKNQISSVLPESAADRSGLWYKDEIIAINGFILSGSLHKLAKFIGEGPVELTINRDQTLRKVSLMSNSKTGYKKYSVIKKTAISADQSMNYIKWKRS